jgi:hypothetical protein
MEEILASIRQIISEDGEGSQAPESKDAKSETAISAGPDAPAEAEESEESAAEPHAIRSESAEAEAEPEPQFEPEHESAFAHGESMTPQSSGSAAEAEPYAPFAASAHPQPEPTARPHGSARRDDRNLLSAQSDQAVHGAFSALAHTILAQNARTLEDLVQEMLQPMLKSWLDDNLPTLVERLVHEEIQRVSRGRP